jgi:maleylacetoacetate isomerase
LLKLYSFWRSSAAYRVRIALALKHQPYDYVPVHLVQDGGQQNKPQYRALNPQGRVPLLVDGEFRVAQSLAILDYLEAKFPQPALVPANSAARARMLSFCHAIVSDTHPLQNTATLKYLGEQFGADDARKAAWNRHWIERGLTVLEEECAPLPLQDFVFGNSVSWADCVLVPQMYNAERWQCDLALFPRLYALSQRLREQPAFAAAHPDRQPDAPKK